MPHHDPRTVGEAELLEHSEWMRALARRLVYDKQDADEVVQDAWVALIRRPPLRTVPLRRWIAAVIRNSARQRGRGEARRRRREEAAASAEPAPPADSVVARAESHRAVVAAVLALDEDDEPADARVYVSLADRPLWNVMIHAQARRRGAGFAIAGLPPGELRVRGMSPLVEIVGRTGGEPVDTAEELTLRLPDE